MSPIVCTTKVARPAGEVFAYATDPSRFHEWQEGVISGHLDAATAPRVGTRCMTTRRIGWANRAVTAEITHIDPPRTWGVRGIDGPVRAAVGVTVEPLSTSSTPLTIAIEFHGHGIGRILVPLVVVHEARKEMPNNLSALRHNLEHQTT